MQVPTYDNFQAQPSNQGGGYFQAPSGPAPGQIAGQQLQEAGAAVQRAGGVAAQIALDMQTQVNQTRVNDAMNQAMQARLTLTHDKDAGFLALRGKDALQRPDSKSLEAEYGEKLHDTIAGLQAGLGNEAQRLAFSQQADGMLTQFVGQVQQHRTAEFKTFSLSTQAGTVKVAADQMALDYLNPDALDQSRNAIKAATFEAGRIQGLSGAEITANTIAALSPAHSAVIASALQDGRVDYAKQYLTTVNAELTPADRLKLGEALKITDTRVKAQTFGDDVVQRGLTMDAALAEARAKFQGKEEDEAVREVKDRYTEKEVERIRDVKNTGQAAWSAVMATGRIPAPMLADLRAKAPEEERQIRDWLEAKNRRAKADAENKFETDMNVYYGLRRMAMDDPTAFSQLDLRKSEPYLKDGDLKHLIEIQGSVTKGDAKAMESQRITKQTLGAIRSEVAAIGIDLTPKEGTPAAQETNKFMGALTQALDAATQAKGSPLTGDEAKRIGMGMVQEGVKQGSGMFGMFQTKQRGYQIATDPNVAPGDSYVLKRFSDIPPTTRDALAADYRAKKGMGTRAFSADDEAAIERAYTRGVQSGRIK